MQRIFAVVTALFIFICGYYFWLSTDVAEVQEYIYPIDDAYIHLAIARNFAEHGAWSVNSFGFESASSSILYTVILSFCIKVFGNSEIYPLLINLVCGIGVIAVTYKFFKDFYGKNELFLGLLLLLPFTTLHAMTLLGMEHTLHMFIFGSLLYFVKKYENSGKISNLFLVLIFLNGAIRYESMFFTVCLAFCFFLRKDYLKGMLTIFLGFLPIVIFGLISIQNGGFFFPNSVMIKGSYPESQHLLMNIWDILKNGIFLNFSFYKYLLLPFLILALYIYKVCRNSGNILKETLILSVVGTAVLHTLFAVLEYRYQNYLLLGMLFITVPEVGYFWNRRKELSTKWLSAVSFILFFGICIFSVYRFYYYHPVLKFSSKNIHDQQIQVAEFLKTNYAGEKVMANDIGAVAYFGNVDLMDVVGLGNTDVAKFETQHKNSSKEIRDQQYPLFIQKYAEQNGYKIAVLYPEWFPNGKVPASWIPVASWKLKGEIKGVAQPRVVFYATDTQSANELRTHLKNFHVQNSEEHFF